MSNKDTEKQVLECLKAIKQQTDETLKKLDEQDKKIEQLTEKAIKKGSLSGAIAGGVSGGLIAVSIEFIKAKIGL